mgnify:CR=1 FL=1
MLRRYLTLLLLFSITITAAAGLWGCGGKQGMNSPHVYGDGARDDENSEATEDDSPERAAEVQDDSYRSALHAHRVNQQDPNEVPADASESSDEPGQAITLSYGGADISDSASAIDDDIWRKFDMAEEFYLMGVMANREASWEEAQYYFEKGLRILAKLDIETDDSLLTPEAATYSRMLDNFVADYRSTLRSLGHLESDVSASVVIERFGSVAENLGSDSIRVYERTEKPEVTYDLPVHINDRVKSSIVYFQTVAYDAFAKYLRRSQKYTPMQRRILAEYGLPSDLIYLSLIESGYNPHAYSWARAMGLWQFISSTGRMYDLHRSWWIDERKDPIKATHAACRFLKDLYNEFGDWELAMAAYNGGPGRVRGSIRRQKTNDFWKLRLKRQTMDYVPLIYAAAIIAKNPEKYGFTDIEFEPEVVWDEVTIDRCLELKTVARELGCSVEELRELNPELLRKYTPPDMDKYVLKVPKGSVNRFWASYDEMPSPEETSWVRHTIRRGESVSTIASRYGVSQYAILQANNLSRRSTIYAGKQLIVPVPLDRSQTSRAHRSYEAEDGIYSVRSGDTMWDIARAFGTTVDALRRSNYIERGSRIYVGQKMKIPASASKLKEKSKQSPSPQTYASADSKSTQSGSKGKHKVRSGDTLWDIARLYGTTTANIRRLNGLGRSSRIYPGQLLTVSNDGAPRYVIHKVRRGENLSWIAQKYRTTIARITASNDINDPDNLRIGDRLKIYVK